MFSRTAALLLASGLVTTGVAFSQTLPNLTQQAIFAVPDGPMPIFRVVVVGRTLPAVNYRPRHGDTKIDFAGTPLLPLAHGTATVSGKQGYIQIEAKFEKLQPATKFGREYLTYVLWAITPEGRATNLGEIQVDDANSKVKVTTELQAFGLIVTAEPYFAVTQPSDLVVMENVVRNNTNGSVEIVQAKYELLKRGSYLMSQDVSRFTVKTLEPGAPLDLAEARNAVALAHIAGADQFAKDTYDKAAGLLADAERARNAHRGSNAIMMPARQAAQTAEDARLIGIKDQEDKYAADQQALALTRERDANARAQSEEARRRAAERDTQTATAGLADAERARADADAGRIAAERDKADADAARLAAERDTANAVDAANTAADAARDAANTAADASRAQAETARLASEAQAQNAAAQSEQEKSALRQQLRQQLNVILETRETARGLIVSLSDVLFDTGSATLKPGAREKLARVSGILVSHPGLRMSVEGYTDNVGTDASNQALSLRRADSVQAYLVQQKIPADTIATAGFGETQPVATNGTAAGRQQNRRVELVVTGDIIGRR